MQRHKTFVIGSRDTCISNEDLKEDEEETQSPVPGSGNEVAAFYDSMFSSDSSTTKDLPICIISPSNENEIFHCLVCKVQVPMSEKIAHTCSLLHQLNRSKGKEVKKVYLIPRGNPGYQLLLKNGWKEAGLGKNEEGSLDPIKTRIKNDRLGIGETPLRPLQVTHSQKQEGAQRKNLHKRTLPDVSRLDLFSALHELRTKPQERYGISKRHRELLLKRERVKRSILRKELYRK